jgi:hypothetical protein
MRCSTAREMRGASYAPVLGASDARRVLCVSVTPLDELCVSVKPSPRSLAGTAGMERISDEWMTDSY